MTVRAGVPQMKWWGWGDPAHVPRVPEHALALLREEIGIAEQPRPPVELEQVRVPEIALPGAARDALVRALGSDGVRDDLPARVSHAAGRSYVDLVRLRAGAPAGAPDAVLLPETPERVAAALDACAEHRVAVVPFGGGTSVVGGLEPLRGEHAAVVALDLAGLRRVVAIDEHALTATLQGGLRVRAAEAELGRAGLTLGHFPQSYEYVTVGGCVATRSAGQASTGYGRIDEMVLGLRCRTPAGDLDIVPRAPRSAAGPDLRELVVGSEGVLGVITEATLRVRPRPAVRRYEGFAFRDFAQAVEAFRALEQGRAAPDIARLSDEEETRVTLAQAGEGTGARALKGYLRVRGASGGCLAIFGWEGEPATVGARRARSVRVVRRHGGIALGPAPGRAWERARFSTPYLRDDLLERGVLVETLETATSWSGLLDLHAAVAGALRAALAAQGTPPIVACHVSHLYPSGASLYFTVFARQREGEEISQWSAAKRAAGDAIAAQGATITHHHAVGRDHVPWIEHEDGPLGIAALRAVKRELDPAGIMNPGKLLPAA